MQQRLLSRLRAGVRERLTAARIRVRFIDRERWKPETSKTLCGTRCKGFDWDGRISLRWTARTTSLNRSRIGLAVRYARSRRTMCAVVAVTNGSFSLERFDTTAEHLINVSGSTLAQGAVSSSSTVTG